MTFYLVDKSAWEWSRRDAASSADLAGLLRDSHIFAGSHLTALEMAYFARTADDHATVIARQRAARWLPVTEAVMDRALEVGGATCLARPAPHTHPRCDHRRYRGAA